MVAFPKPYGLAFHAATLWCGSFPARSIRGLNAHSGAVERTVAAPGVVYGLTAVDGSIFGVCGDANDDRWIARCDGRRKDADRLACPDRTGSHLAAHDGRWILGRRFDRRICWLDRAGGVTRTLPVPFEITGMTVVGDELFVVATDSVTSADYGLYRLSAGGSGERPRLVGTLPFLARGLAWDGARLWTSARDSGYIAAFDVTS